LQAQKVPRRFPTTLRKPGFDHKKTLATGKRSLGKLLFKQALNGRVVAVVQIDSTAGVCFLVRPRAGGLGQTLALKNSPCSPIQGPKAGRLQNPRALEQRSANAVIAVAAT